MSCPIDVSFDSNQIGDQGMKDLAINGDKLKFLQQISLSFNQITDEGLKVLAVHGEKFQNLKEVRLNNNNHITD